MTLYKSKYRIESTRLEGWDYSKNGYYFVTICTRNGECLLGKVVDGIMQLSTAGEIVREEWCKTERIRNNVTLDKWIIMPNHLHGIVIIHNNNNVETPRRGVSDCRGRLRLPGRLRLSGRLRLPGRLRYPE